MRKITAGMKYKNKSIAFCLVSISVVLLQLITNTYIHMIRTFSSSEKTYLIGINIALALQLLLVNFFNVTEIIIVTNIKGVFYVTF